MTEARFLLDTNICIYLAEDLSDLLFTQVEKCAEGELATSSVAFAEFARGIDWALPDARTSVDRLFRAIPVLPFDYDAAVAYAGLPFVRHRFDRLIAAHALVLNLTLITANPSDFRDIAGLKVEDWTR